MPYIDIRVEFELDEKDEDGYQHARPTKVRRIATDLPDAVTENIGDASFQSDKYTVDVANAMLSALDGSITPV